MLLFADVSLRDERPPKRRKIDEANKQDQPAVTVWCSPQSASLPSCSVCNQSLGTNTRSTSCSSCHTLVCSTRCTAICDATLKTQPQPPTPPLLSDEDSVAGSSPTTPVRYSTPEPLDPQLLRARLNAAAAATNTTMMNSFQQSSNNLSSWHSNHMQLDHYQPANLNANASVSSTSSGQSNALSIGSSNLHKKRKRKSYCASISSSSTSSFNADLSSASAVDAFNSNGNVNCPVSRQQQQYVEPFMPRVALDAPVAEIGRSLSALSAAQSSGNGHGCSVRLCLNCLVTTSDGHKICFPCLEESFTC